MKKSYKYILIIGIILINYLIFVSTFSNTINEKSMAQVDSISINVPYSINYGYTWQNSSYPHVDSAESSITYNISSNIIYNNNNYSSNRLTISASYTSSSTKDRVFIFRLSADSTYPSINIFVSRSNNNNLIYGYYLTGTDSIQLNSNDIILSFLTSPNTILPYSSLLDLQFALNSVTTYSITANLSNCILSTYTLIDGTTNTINIIPDNGYTYPSSISYTGTAYDIQYFDEAGEIIITNPTSNFTIQASASLPGYTINQGAYLLPRLETFVQLSNFNVQTDNNFYFLNYNLENNFLINSDDIYYPFLTSTPTIYQSYTLQKVGGSLIVLNEENTGKFIIGYDDLDFSEPAYTFYQFNLLIVPSNFQTQSANLNDFISSCYLVNSNYPNIVNAFNQQFAYYSWYYDSYGYESGYDSGYDSGYQIGYTDGINDNIISNNVTGLISAIFNGLFGTIFSVEIFPGFPLYIFIMIPLVFAVLGIILWLIRGR